MYSQQFLSSQRFRRASYALKKESCRLRREDDPCAVPQLPEAQARERTTRLRFGLVCTRNPARKASVVPASRARPLDGVFPRIFRQNGNWEAVHKRQQAQIAGICCRESARSDAKRSSPASVTRRRSRCNPSAMAVQFNATGASTCKLPDGATLPSTAVSKPSLSSTTYSGRRFISR